MEHLTNAKWELFSTAMIVFVGLNAGANAATGVAMATALCWHMAAGKADCNLMVTFTRWLLAAEISAGDACCRVLGQVAGGFIAALLHWGLTGAVAGPVGAAKDTSTLVYEGIATAFMLCIFQHAQGSLKTTEQKAFAFAITLWAVSAFTVNPALSIGPHLLQDGGLPSNFWAIWFGPFIGLPLYAIFGFCLNGQAVYAKQGGATVQSGTNLVAAGNENNA